MNPAKYIANSVRVYRVQMSPPVRCIREINGDISSSLRIRSAAVGCNVREIFIAGTKNQAKIAWNFRGDDRTVTRDTTPSWFLCENHVRITQ